MISSKILQGCTASLLTLPILFTGVVQAAAPEGARDDDTMSEVVVTATRRAENLQRVPITVAVHVAGSMRAR